MFAWASRSRLTPMRMVWFEENGVVINHNSPKYEMAKYPKKSRRAWPKLDFKRESRIEYHKWVHTISAGRLGEWPQFKYNKKL